ncbi:MAG: 4-phosphoerythronate dehydrogenase [Pseudomonadales bacterium]|nr:4-phosphoerythronate dehydrogenase [Pseudomonadales bacterium]
MKIVADENIPYLKEFFGSFGEIIQLPGRKISAASVSDADVLLVRSITPVDAALLENSKVGFVGSATIGMDHLDCEYMQNKGIQFENAPGCNADSVVQYVLAALLHLAKFYNIELEPKTVGIIGCGNIGSRLRDSLAALGIRNKIYDPFLSEADSDSLVSFEEVINCDIVTLHVPISKTGAFPTHHMINEQTLAQMKPDAVLINSSRGAVVDNRALLQSLQITPRLVVLDVWENEPAIDWRLLNHLALATPHIAGYSAEGKARGTEMLYQALSAWLGQTPNMTLDEILPPGPIQKIKLGSEPIEPLMALDKLLGCCYSIESDDKRLRLIGNDSDRNVQFDLLRKNYGGRREFCSLELEHNKSTYTTLYSRLAQLGFKLSCSESSFQ